MPKNSLTFETAFDAYTSLGVIGEGGAGRVHHVANIAGEQLALKVLAPEHVTDERRRRFKNEIEFGQRQTHNHVVRVLDTGHAVLKDKKCPFYVMPLYPGTLRQLMADLPPDKVLGYLGQLLDGVEAAHLKAVWHRDLKPENILWDKKADRLVVADFGIAHFEEEEIYTAAETRIAARMANFQYSAPEQRQRGAPVDHRADIYAVGLILNEMFTGRIPQGSGYKRIGVVAPDFKYLDDLVERMTQQESGNRPTSIADIKKELIGRKHAFIALQKVDEARREVVPAHTPAAFDPIIITSFDFEDGELILRLNRDPPPEWKQEFRQPTSGVSYLQNYPPTGWRTGMGLVAIKPFHDNTRLIQELVNYGTQYAAAANKKYVEHLRFQAQRKQQQEREALEQRIAAADARKRILESVKL